MRILVIFCEKSKQFSPKILHKLQLNDSSIIYTISDFVSGFGSSCLGLLPNDVITALFTPFVLRFSAAISFAGFFASGSFISSPILSSSDPLFNPSPTATWNTQVNRISLWIYKGSRPRVGFIQSFMKSGYILHNYS